MSHYTREDSKLVHVNKGIHVTKGKSRIQNKAWPHHIDGSVQDCSNSSALAMELLQSCTKPSMYLYVFAFYMFP